MNPEFFVGVNLPWFTYGCDFGANLWQAEGGIGRPGGVPGGEQLFARLAAAGLRTVRWFALCDGRAGIVFDEHGTPSGLDAFFFRDFDAGLALASRYGLTLIPVLIDFLWCARARRVNHVLLGGRRAVLASTAKRDALVEQVLYPLLTRYGREPVIYAWDLFNEPEWATLGYGSIDPRTAVRPNTMKRVLAEMAQVAGESTRQRITVGLASPKGLRLLPPLPGEGRHAPVDLAQVHWYDRRSPTLYRRDLPGDVVLGEFPTKGSSSRPADVIDMARSHGYRGALGWSALAGDRHSDLVELEKAVKALASDTGRDQGKTENVERKS